MSRTRIKICGLTRPEDAAVASAAGADAIGVILAPSKRRVTVEQAAEICRRVPAFTMKVGVFVDPTLEEVREAVERAGLGWVQLHGDESPEFCAAVGVPVTKTFRVGPDFDPSVAERYEGAVSLLLLDTFVPGEAGGTGVAFDWQALAGRLPKVAPIAVGGGLRPENVGEAVRLLRPFAVDVSSGVEVGPGVKSVGLIDRFVQAVWAADQEVQNV